MFVLRKLYAFKLPCIYIVGIGIGHDAYLQVGYGNRHLVFNVRNIVMPDAAAIHYHYAA